MVPHEEIVQAREIIDRLRKILPAKIEVKALGVWSKAPYQLLATREALIWRTEELARNVCDALEGGDIAVAAILTRSIIENASVLWKLMDLLEGRAKSSRQALNKILMRFLVGSKQKDAKYQAVQILNCVDLVDKNIPGFRFSYDMLSEFTHPNWSGVAGLYSKVDAKNFTTHFGRNLVDVRGNTESIAGNLLGSLQIFEHCYNQINHEMASYLKELRPFSEEREADSPDDEET